MLFRKDYKDELALFPREIKIGEKGSGYTKQIQEWLCLHKYHSQGFNVSVELDDWYGKATKAAVKYFQEVKGIETTGEVDHNTWITLTGPLMRAFRTIKFRDEDSIQTRLVAYMHQFLNEHPTELNSNKGPWVRAFMKGEEGDWAAWCNGLVSTALDHAANSMGDGMDKWLPWSWSTVQTKKNASSPGYSSVYIINKEVGAGMIDAGDLFLVMKGSTPKHIGVVSKVEDGVCWTIEGNTNDEGIRDGYEVCMRCRDLLNGKYSIIKLI